MELLETEHETCSEPEVNNALDKESIGQPLEIAPLPNLESYLETPTEPGHTVTYLDSPHIFNNPGSNIPGGPKRKKGKATVENLRIVLSGLSVHPTCVLC